MSIKEAVKILLTALVKLYSMSYLLLQIYLQALTVMKNVLALGKLAVIMKMTTKIHLF